MPIEEGEIEVLFRSAESEARVERKESIADPDRICQAICAFSNDLPGSGATGVIFVGQRDDLSCAGLTVDTRLLETIGGWRATGKFQPFPIMSVRAQSIMGCTVAVIAVEPSENTPVRYDGRVWIRVGPRRALASPEEERRLTEKRRAQNIPPDARGVSGASPDDLDLARFTLEYLPAALPAEVLAENGREPTQQMRALRLLDGQDRPTMTGILVLGNATQRFFPGAWVSMLRIDGELLTDPIIDQHELTGTVPTQIRQMEELATLWIQTSAQIAGPNRREQADYPIEALRQLFRNALLHRNYEGTNAPVRVTWYNDRVEILSPGGLFGQVTPEAFNTPGVTDYRNPTLAEALHSLGFVERFGVGLQIVARELRRNGNPPAEYRLLPNFVLAVARKRP
jgi:ATP-dependent DNA helicase RecG